MDLDEHSYSPALLCQPGDMSGLRRILDQHNVSAKARNDILVEASKIVYSYQQLVDHLARQKRLLEKEVDHMKLSEAPSPQGRPLASPAESELSKMAEPQSMFQVKEEPLEDEDEVPAGDKLDRLQLQREGRRMLMA
ncbi:hypothetical protein BIW11_12224 [Tropilaelaps mercedesae]|uniref:Uncharacterized protein n=1 Tax=Tropilaelaps mercedesae TaxID=418985 RepID=A0A1V9X7J6_9ACAR|nr:hypothetical protein BIW11_12224 [Tropilaelaps mercedesae]